MLSIILFYLTFFANLFLAATRSVIFIFVLYQFYYFFNPQTKWWAHLVPNVSFSFYIVLTLIVVVGFTWPQAKDARIRDVPVFKWIYGIALLYGLASFYAVDPLANGIAFDAILTAVVIVTLVYKLCDSDAKLNVIIKGYVFSATFMGYYITQFGRVSGGRYSGGGMVDSPDANGIAAALAPAVLFCFYYFWTERKWYLKGLFVLCAAFLVNGLIQIGSRGSILGLGCGMMLFLFLLYRSRIQEASQKKKIIAVVIVGLVAVPFVTDQIFWERIVSIKSEATLTEEKESGSTRVFFWKAAIDMSFDKPFGGGTNAFIYYSPIYLPDNLDTGGSRNRAVHSTWFEVLSEIGYPGLICLTMTIISSLFCMRRCIRVLADKSDPRYINLIYAIVAALASFLIAMTFLNRIRAEIFYWLILFICCAYNIYYVKRHSVKNDSAIAASDSALSPVKD